MRNTVGNTAAAELNTLDLAQLVCSLLASYPVYCVAALCVEHKAEVLAGLVDRDNIHQSSRESRVGAHFAVDLDKTLHKDRLDFASIEGVLQTISEEDDEGQRIAELVRTGRSLGGVCTLNTPSQSIELDITAAMLLTRKLVKEPVRWRAETLLVLLPVISSQRNLCGGRENCIAVIRFTSAKYF